LAVASTSAIAAAPTTETGACEATRASIARLTASLLRRAAFSGPLTDERFATRLIDDYLDALDGNRTLLLETDVEQLTADRIALAHQIQTAGDTRIARVLFDRYLLRLTQQVSFDDELLRATPFEFTGRDSYDFDRSHAARPHDLASARELWRQELRSEYLDEKLSKPTASARDVAAALQRRHARHLRDMRALTEAEIFDAFLDALAHAYDLRADYLGREDLETYSELMSLSLVGVGASVAKVAGTCTIEEVATGSPAERAGLKPGDRVMYVGDGAGGLVDLTALPLRKAIRFLRGPEGSAVELRVLPPAGAGTEARTVKLVRARVSLGERRAKGWLVDVRSASGEPLHLGRLQLPSFYTGPSGGPGERGSASADLKAILTDFKAAGARGVLLDLRHDPGGSLEEAIRVAGLFVGKGPLVQTRDLRGDIAVANHEVSNVVFDGPLIVLVDRMSASASELVAGALQDRGRALIVGDPRTFGKGTVQTMALLAPLLDRIGLDYAFDPGGLKYTVAKFYRPGGESPDGRGVAVDIVLPSLDDVSAETTEATAAKPADSVPPASFDRENRVRPFLATLRALSAKRVHVDAAFAAIEAEVADARQRAAHGSVSLNETERRQELSRSLGRRRTIEERARAATAASREVAPPSISAEAASNAAGPDPTSVRRNDRPSAPADRQLPSRAGAAEDEIVAQEGMAILSDYVRLSTAAVSSARAVGFATSTSARSRR
jgi:carboxyl-terminal processing protease